MRLPLVVMGFDHRTDPRDTGLVACRLDVEPAELVGVLLRRRATR